MKCFQWVEMGKKMEMVTRLPEGYEIEYCQEQYKDGELFVLVGLFVDMEPVIVRITPRPYGASLQVEVRGIEYCPICENSEELEDFIRKMVYNTNQ